MKSPGRAKSQVGLWEAEQLVFIFTAPNLISAMGQPYETLCNYPVAAAAYSLEGCGPRSLMIYRYRLPPPTLIFQSRPASYCLYGITPITMATTTTMLKGQDAAYLSLACSGRGAIATVTAPTGGTTTTNFVCGKYNLSNYLSWLAIAARALDLSHFMITVHLFSIFAEITPALGRPVPSLIFVMILRMSIREQQSLGE